MMIEEKVWFEKINNKRVFCVLTESDNSQKKILIMSHGFRGSSIGPARTFVDFSRLLVKNGFSTLRFDQPNSANSEGDYVDSSFREWVESIVYLGKKYLELGYEVSLLGQSMGATATMIATGQLELKNKINKIILWVPDPETDFNQNPMDLGEESGQQYKNTFWKEAKEMDFFGCLDSFDGRIHLVYGENDKFVELDLRNQTIAKVKNRGGEVMILEGQDHSSWEYNQAQKVFREELSFLEG